MYTLRCILFTVMKSRRAEMGGPWGTHMGEKMQTYRLLSGKCEGNNRFEVLGIDVMIILKWVIKKWDKETWVGLI